MSPPSFLILILFYFCFIISLSHALKNGFSVELIHRDSPKSPLYQPTQNKYQHFVNAARRSINRANYFNKKGSLTKNIPESTIIPDDGEFLMSYSVGTPPFKQFGIVDTVSNLIWLQCAPCKQCYNQTTPMFEPSKSSSYKNISCSSEKCKSMGGGTDCNDQNNCKYDFTYIDGSKSQGDINIETFTLDSINGDSISFPKTIIGCGNYNEVSYEGASSGRVGLGGGHVSLPAQLKSSIGGKFSYCLTPLSSMSKKTSKLNFGDAAVVSGDGVVSTPLGKKITIEYFLTLDSFSVGNESIKLGTITNDIDDEGNIIIDSGTTLTLLPSDVYANLETAVVKLVRLEQVKDPNHEFNLCFQITSDGYDFPIITAHFKGGDIKLHSIHTFVPVADGIVCFAFAPSPFHAIFGNVAQQNLLVGYDTQHQIVSFKPTDCTKISKIM